MRRVLILFAVFNVFASLSIVFGLSMARGTSWLWITDHAQRMEQAEAVDYERLGTVVLGKAAAANRDDLEHVMGLEKTNYFSYAATALMMLTVVQTGMLVFCALRIPGAKSGSGSQPSALAGDVPQR